MPRLHGSLNIVVYVQVQHSGCQGGHSPRGSAVSHCICFGAPSTVESPVCWGSLCKCRATAPLCRRTFVLQPRHEVSTVSTADNPHNKITSSLETLETQRPGQTNRTVLDAYYALALKGLVDGHCSSKGRVCETLSQLCPNRIFLNLVARAWSIVGGGLAGRNPLVYSMVVDKDQLYVAGHFQYVKRSNRDAFEEGLRSHSVAMFDCNTGLMPSLRS